MTSQSPLISESWERSLKHGLRRQDHALFSDTVSKSLTKRIFEENHLLVSHASLELSRLYRWLGSARWTALCLNARGQIVCSAGDHASAPREIQALMYPGRSLLESDLGTTAPGCVLKLGRPMVVSRGEHFLTELASFVCASAPIHAPDGSLMGALDLSGFDVDTLPLTRDMVVLAARVIENSMVRELGEAALVRFHCDDRLIGTPFEAVLAVSRDGSIGAANRVARQLLSLPNVGPISESLETLLGKGIVDRLRGDQTQPAEQIKVHTRLGAIAHLRLDSVATSPRARSVVSNHIQRVRTLASGRAVFLNDQNLASNFGKAERMLRHGLPVLLEGETGTGKEVFARALHEGNRPRGPFVALNCGAIPEGLIEAELFGYADGAFTGGRKGGAAGKIEQAHGGTLFLDEIGDMPIAMQSRLLRVIQERCVTRVGHSREIPVDILVLSATHRRLDELISTGRFREDLFYRLNAFTLRLPALREREDLSRIVDELLVWWNSKSIDSEPAKVAELITPRALSLLVNYSWPGNIRQLEQTLRALLALRSQGSPIDSNDLPDDLRRQGTAAFTAARDGTESLLEAAESEVIHQALQDHGGNLSSAARALGISRTTLYKKLRRSAE